MRFSVGNKAKSYRFLGQTWIHYRQLLDEIGFPEDEELRWKFTDDVGEYGQNKYIFHGPILADLMGEDHQEINEEVGILFVTEEVKILIIKKYIDNVIDGSISV